MAKPTRQLICGIEFSAEADVKNSLDLAKGNRYDFVVLPMFHPGLDRGENCHNSTRPLSRSSFALDSSDWCRQVVGKISPSIDVDSSDVHIRKRSEKLLLQELGYACHFCLPEVVVPLRSTNCTNLARIINSQLTQNHELKIWIRLPLENPKIVSESYRSDTKPSDHDSPWDWWNTFRLLCDSHRRLGVVLDIGSDLPTELDRSRWLAEPITALIISTSVFLTNNKGYPVFSQKHQQYIRSLLLLDTQIILSGPKRQDPLHFYKQYLDYFWDKTSSGSNDEVVNRGFEDYLQCPLQPLMHNLEAQTYEVFEKDPVKYKVYKEAIYSALIDRVSEDQKDNVVTVIMVMGAGRGPLVNCALKAGEESGRKVRVFAVEKNPNAVITLQCRRDEEWGDNVTVLSGDMRHLQGRLEEKADILVSELLGSFGDNELSPECLDGAQAFLKDDGVCIPESYTSYVCPVMSHRLHVDARNGYVEPGKLQSSTLETLYVVLQRNKMYLDSPQKLFTFRHPNKDFPIDNTRYASKTFESSTDGILHGFSGFFDTVLYKSHILSIAPENFSVGMFSWFPIFMPIQRPVPVRAGNPITGHFWRQVGENSVWYEWTITAPEPLPVHNVNGRSCKIGL